MVDTNGQLNVQLTAVLAVSEYSRLSRACIVRSVPCGAGGCEWTFKNNEKNKLKMKMVLLKIGLLIVCQKSK